MIEQWQQSLSREQVIDYLLSFEVKGFKIIEGRPPIANGWTIFVDSLHWVGIRPGNVEGNWSVCISNLGRSIGEVGTLEDLYNYVAQAFRGIGLSIDSPPQNMNVYKNEPVSNLSKLVTLIGKARVVFIIDDYFENTTLKHLITMRTLGVNFNADLKILTTKIRIKAERLNKNFIASFNNEAEVGMEIRILAEPHHQRLIMLNDGKCLSPDFSLNDFNNQGSINTLSEVAKIREEFYGLWENSTPVEEALRENASVLNN